MRLISVVLPVYNESESIAACLRGLASALASEDHEILVCYDSEEDTTLAAIAAMSDRSPHVRLVRNTIGRGALNAIRTGFQAARGDVVVTSMADLSDPPAVILEMAKAIRSGADVVSGSRYMRGGSQSGGPWLKRTLSRIAGVSLRWIAGLGTHDATSNFRGYSRAFLDTVAVESRGGFEIALELTVKAHLAGKVVAEVPSSWVDRSAGKSNFRLWRWMPSYLRWYLRAMAEPALVLGVWLTMLVAAVRYVAMYGSPIPYMDDYYVVQRLGRPHVLALDWLWSAHNEHRIPLPRLILVGLMELTRDLRSLMFLEVGLLAVASLVLILAVRRRRGPSRATDAFFPLLFLSLAHHENLLSAFQIAFVLPATIATAILASLAVAAPAADRRLALRVGVLLLLLPLCGGAGLLQVPPIAVWLAFEGFSARRSEDAARRRSAPALLVASAAAVLLFALYFVGFSKPAPTFTATPPIRILGNALDLLSSGAGRLTWEEVSLMRWLVLLLGAAALARLAFRDSGPHAARGRELGLLACGLGSVTLALGIGWGRGEQMLTGIAPRYVSLFAPFLALVYVAWSANSAGRAGRAVQWSLLLGMLALLPTAISRGRNYGESRRRANELLTADVDARLDFEGIAERNWRSFFVDETGFATCLAHLRRLGLPPYRAPEDGPDEDRRTVRPFFRFGATPIETRSDGPIVRRRVFDRSVVQVRAPAEFVFEIPPRARQARGEFGVPPLAYENPKRATRGLRFVVERSGEPGSGKILLEEVLDPAQRVEDRGIRAFAVDLRPGSGGRLVLRIEATSAETGAMNWGFWTGLEFETY